MRGADLCAVARGADLCVVARGADLCAVARGADLCEVARGADLCAVARGADLCVVARINIVGRTLFDALLVNEIYTSFNESFEIEFCPDVNLCRRRFIRVGMTSPQSCYMMHRDELAFIIQHITIAKDRER